VAGNCPGPSCSLRDALAAAAAGPAGVSDDITFDPTVFPTGPGAAVQTIKLGSALTIGSNVSIVGPGANLLTISGQGQVQVFTVNSGLAASISGLTVANGHALGDGGGIDNSGTLTVSNTTISGNTAITDGGGIFNTATLTVSNSTISDNTASNSGGIFSSSALMVTNGILTGDTGGECIGAGCPTSGTNGNLVSGVALAPLGFYGGPTQTMAPLPGSTALNAGVFQTGEPTTDQRGALRPSTAHAPIDAGAVQITDDAPMIGQILPGSGPTAGGTTVTITGTGFDAASGSGNIVSAIDFGVTPASAFTVTPATATAAAYVMASSPAATRAGTVDITITNNFGTTATTANDEFTYFAPVAISTTTLPNATWNSGYSRPLVATGGSGSYSWTASDNLRTGLALSGSGSTWTLSGTPSATGSFSFSLTATDSANPANLATQAYTIDVLATPIVNIGLPNPGLIFGQSGTITVTLAPPPGLSILPSGTITYSIDGGAPSTVGSSGGRASIPTAATLAAGSHTVVISYSGDVNYSGVSNAETTLTIGAPISPLDFTFTDTGASAFTAAPGAVASYSFGLSPLNSSYMGPVSFTVSGLPAGATASFTPSTIAANGGATTVQMAVQTAAPMAQSRGGALGRGMVLALLLVPFSMKRTVRVKLKGRTLLLVLLAGMTAAVSGCGSSNGFLLQSPQTYTLTVSGTSGTLVHSQTVTLNVQ
jgi:hypothetical protein